MGRRHRIQLAGAWYHVTMRGNNRGPIFNEDADRRMFLETLGRAKVRHGWGVHGYCLMTNHYHLLLETPHPNIGEGMRWFNTLYSHRFNQAHGRVGHLFQRRYADGYISDEAHLREVVRYVPLNPVRAGMCKRPEEYQWSSYAPTLGLAQRPPFLTVRSVLGLFDAERDRAREELRRWVDDALAQPRKVPHQAPLITVLRPGAAATADDIASARAQGYTLSEIGRHLGISHTTVRRRMLARA
jgi:REP element-mobilizing transposase RayT